MHQEMITEEPVIWQLAWHQRAVAARVVEPQFPVTSRAMPQPGASFFTLACRDGAVYIAGDHRRSQGASIDGHDHCLPVPSPWRYRARAREGRLVALGAAANIWSMTNEPRVR